ncbi:hypothetical protein HA402_013277 [Bradysia odoriphaga]|nr:hypothetical protein HA402_013277 [Bradysia odoriphaga]
MSADKANVKSISSETIKDIYCLPENPRKVLFEDVQKAFAVVSECTKPTPFTKSKLSEVLGMNVFFKKEFLQYTGSFKERGALYALTMLSDEQKKKGVVAASLGNHSQGMSYHSKRLNIPCTVVMPHAAPHNKVKKCRNFGANVIIHGNDMAEALSYAMLLAKEKGMTYINGYDHPHIIAGQGTVAMEIVAQMEDHIDAIVVPVGGGGLIAGVATAAKALLKDVQIIGVETENSQGFTNALAHGKPIYTPTSPSLADGLVVPTVGYNAFATAQPLVDKMIVIKEEWIHPAMLQLVELEKSVVEGAAAAGLGAILSGQMDEFKNKNVAVILCGGNIDSNIFGRCIERGLVAVGRLLRFRVTVSDKPGSLTELCSLTSAAGVSITQLVQERQFCKSIHNIELKVICETRDYEHTEYFKKLLHEHYGQVEFNDSPLKCVTME